MYSLPSASKMCEPCPRTMNGASPPTERNARTGEFTPPGIICSARCCSLRDISVFRAMGSPRGNWSSMVTVRGKSARERLRMQSQEGQWNLPDIYILATVLKHDRGTLYSVHALLTGRVLRTASGGSELS